MIPQIFPRPFFWTLQDAPLLPHFQCQLAGYEKARQPKEFQAFRSLEEGFGGPAWDKNVAAQIDFLKRYVFDEMDISYCNRFKLSTLANKIMHRSAKSVTYLCDCYSRKHFRVFSMFCDRDLHLGSFR